MALPVVEIESQGALSVEVFVGQAQFGTYQLRLWSKDGKKNKKIGEGLNTDDIPDIVEIPGTPKQNDAKIVHWRVRVAALSAAPGQHFAVIVSIRQDAKAVPGGTFSWSGPLGAAAIEIDGGARLKV